MSKFLKQNVNKFCCPDCGHPQYCPCESCLEHFPPPEGIEPWVWQADMYHIACGGCGVVRSADEWEFLEYQYWEGL